MIYEISLILPGSGTSIFHLPGILSVLCACCRLMAGQNLPGGYSWNEQSVLMRNQKMCFRYKQFALVIMLLLVWLLAGCAGTATGKKTSVLKNDESLSVVDNSRSRADVMVVIRYPAIVDEAAVRAYYRAFEQNIIGASYKADAQTRRDTDNIAQSIITKSNYFAMSLYRELQEDLPPHSVLLSPHLVVLDEKDQLSSRPLLASEEIPSVVTIDFNIYSHPNPDKIMDSEPLTFGDIVTPLFVIHANRWLAPPIHGLLLASNPLLSTAWKQAETKAEEQFRLRYEQSGEKYLRPLDYITFLEKGYRKVPDIPLKSVGESRREVDAVEQYPIEKIRMDGAVVAVLPSNHSVDPFAEDFVKGAATRIAKALIRVDHDRATFFARQQALARFDPELATAFLTRSNSESVRARLQMAETLIEAERKFLAVQSANLYEGTYSGIYGDQMRQMIAAEYRLLEERRSLARTQNLSTALAVVAMAGAVYAGTGDSGNFLRSQTMSNIMMLSSLWAMNSAISASAQSKTIGENFLLQMAPAINSQVSVQVEWLESREEITARDFAEFRDKTLALYQASIRSISHEAAPGCRFTHPAMATEGRWYGSCFGGLAADKGYGLIIDEAGETIEYFGSAQSGRAHGTGAMIYRSPHEIGAIYYDGGFSEGLPDGTVWLERPGRKPAVRQFRMGIDKGSGDPSTLERVRF